MEKAELIKIAIAAAVGALLKEVFSALIQRTVKVAKTLSMTVIRNWRIIDIVLDMIVGCFLVYLAFCIARDTAAPNGITVFSISMLVAFGFSNFARFRRRLIAFLKERFEVKEG